MNSVLCSIGTRGRYDTTLPLALAAIINQTKKPDKVVIFDDNDEPRDVREELIYKNLFQMMDLKDIQWEWVFAQKSGPPLESPNCQHNGLQVGVENGR